jgi:hypothetical protein
VSIEAITFDFWNTIVRAPAGLMNEARRRAIVEVCAECGVEVDAELLAEALGGSHPLLRELLVSG